MSFVSFSSHRACAIAQEFAEDAEQQNNSALATRLRTSADAVVAAQAALTQTSSQVEARRRARRRIRAAVATAVDASALQLRPLVAPETYARIVAGHGIDPAERARWRIGVLQLAPLTTTARVVADGICVSLSARLTDLTAATEALFEAEALAMIARDGLQLRLGTLRRVLEEAKLDLLAKLADDDVAFRRVRARRIRGRPLALTSLATPSVQRGVAPWTTAMGASCAAAAETPN